MICAYRFSHTSTTNNTNSNQSTKDPRFTSWHNRNVCRAFAIISILCISLLVSVRAFSSANTYQFGHAHKGVIVPPLWVLIGGRNNNGKGTPVGPHTQMNQISQDHCQVRNALAPLFNLYANGCSSTTTRSRRSAQTHLILISEIRKKTSKIFFFFFLHYSTYYLYVSRHTYLERELCSLIVSDRVCSQVLNV